MGRPRKPVNERKQPVTISLSPTDIVILDNLSKAGNKNRSQVISAMLVAKGWGELGLKAVEKHTAMVQNWPNQHQARALGKRYDPDSPHACNVKHKDGKCKHTNCMTVYRRYGVAQ